MKEYDYDIQEAFRAIENELIDSMMRNLGRHKAQEVDEELQWEQWQAKQLEALEKYRRKNPKKFNKEFADINSKIKKAVEEARKDGQTDQEAQILDRIKSGVFNPKDKPSESAAAEFFKLNDRKLDALIEATTNDFEKAEHALLRRADDQYRQIIFNAQVYANTGAGTYEKAVDMATKDFLAQGLTCITYKNGARHTIADYADMAIRTASKRAYLMGESEKREEWGIRTVIVNKRTNPCPKCLPYVGKVLIDDVYGKGSKKDGKYTLLSVAMANGFLHPRCKDAFTTYFPELDEELKKENQLTKEDVEEIEKKNRADAEARYVARQVEKYDRMAKWSLTPENKAAYRGKADRFAEKSEDLTNRRKQRLAQRRLGQKSYKDYSDEYEQLKYSRKRINEEIEQLEKAKNAEERKVIMSADSEAHKNAIEYSEKIKNLKEQLKPVEERRVEIQSMAAKQISEEMQKSGIAETVALSKNMTIEAMESAQTALNHLINEQGLPPLKAVKYDPLYVSMNGGKGAVASYDWSTETMNLGSAVNDPEEFVKRRIASEKAFSERREVLRRIREKHLAEKENELAEAIAKGDKARKTMRTSEITEAKAELAQNRKLVGESVEDVIMHEYGHHVHNKASDGIDKLFGGKELGGRKINGKWYWKDNNVGKMAASEVSYYAAKDPLEAFAESFVAKQKGMGVPDCLDKVVDGAVMKVKKKPVVETMDFDTFVNDFFESVKTGSTDDLQDLYSIGSMLENDIFGELSGKDVLIDRASLERILNKHGSEMRKEEVGLIREIVSKPEFVADNSDRHAGSLVLYSIIPDRNRYCMEVAIVPKEDGGYIIHFHKIGLRKIRKLRKDNKLLVDKEKK